MFSAERSLVTHITWVVLVYMTASYVFLFFMSVFACVKTILKKWKVGMMGLILKGVYFRDSEWLSFSSVFVVFTIFVVCGPLWSLMQRVFNTLFLSYSVLQGKQLEILTMMWSWKSCISASVLIIKGSERPGALTDSFKWEGHQSSFCFWKM